MRQQMAAMASQRRAAVPMPTENIHTVSVTMRDGHKADILVIKPVKTPEGGSPLIVLAFGGGFLIGAKEDLLPTAQKYQDAFGATVVLLTYRLGPEHKFPTAPRDAWDCFQFAVKNVESFGASLDAGLVVGGVSAGANIAAVVARQAVAEKVPLTGVWLNIPPLLDYEIVPEKYKSVFLAREQNAKAAIINEEAISYIKKYYQYDPKSPEYSPFAWPSPVENMPPTAIQVCGQDPLRDDGLIYARVLEDAGVPFRLDIYPGVPHGFNGMFSSIKLAQKHDQDVIDGMAWLLKKSTQ